MGATHVWQQKVLQFCPYSGRGMIRFVSQDLRRQLVVATKSHNGSENGKVDHESSQDAMSLRSRASSISSLDASPVIVPSGSNHNNFLPNGVESTVSYTDNG